MNTSALLKKCIDKIKAMTGNDAEIQYVLGILETLYEMQTPLGTRNAIADLATGIKLPVNITREPVPADLTESDILDRQAEERLKNIKDLAA